jgi:hypothetical protein
MTTFTTVLAFTCAGVMLAQSSLAQPPPVGTAVVITVAAPVFATADASRARVGVAAIGSTLRVIALAEGWYCVNFDDPQAGVRVRFIQSKDVRLSLPNSGRLLLWSSGRSASLMDVRSWSGEVIE